ncbi:amino acid--tRNA ligase-related protein [Candidatus Karelsulcia muelleri]
MIYLFIYYLFLSLNSYVANKQASKQANHTIPYHTIQSIPGGAIARPFITYHNTLKSTFYLRISKELYLNKLLVGGFEKVSELSCL